MSFLCGFRCRGLCRSRSGTRCRRKCRRRSGRLSENLDVDEFVARFDERFRRFLFAEAQHLAARFADAARQTGIVAVTRYDAEAVDRLLVQDVHRVDYQRRIRCVLACGVGILLNRGDRVLQQNAFPCREFRIGEVAVDPLDRRRSVIGYFVEYVFDFPV